MGSHLTCIKPKSHDALNDERQPLSRLISKSILESKSETFGNPTKKAETTLNIAISKFNDGSPNGSPDKQSPKHFIKNQKKRKSP